uniref:hypothetical protein n=1 Tax=Alistipes sp. TaxID=1872444 RepID=UPI00405787B5
MRRSEFWYRERASEGFAPLSVIDKEAIKADYKEVFGRYFSDDFSEGCPNCYQDATILILRKIMAQKNIDAGGYVLKNGVVFKYKGKIITHLNITAAAAEWYIKQNLNNRDKFEELAKDYDSYAEESKNE